MMTEFKFFGGEGWWTVPLTKNTGCYVSVTFTYVEIQCGNKAKKLQNTLSPLQKIQCWLWQTAVGNSPAGMQQIHSAAALAWVCRHRVNILCTLFLWRYSVFVGLTWKAQSESDERNKVTFSNSNERSHIVVLYTVFLYRLLQWWYDYVFNAEENILSFPNIILAFIWKRK